MFQYIARYQICRYIRTSLRFAKEEADDRKTLLFDPARYIRTFDVIFEISCILLRRRLMFGKIALHAIFNVISEVNCVFIPAAFSVDFF